MLEAQRRAAKLIPIKSARPIEDGWIEAPLFALRSGVLRPRGFSGMLGIMPQLKIACG